MVSPVDLSQAFLEAQKKQQLVAAYIEQMRVLDRGVLTAALQTDAEKVAFWVNTYNAFALESLKGRASVLLNPLARGRHFMRRDYQVSGKRLSLNQIEHGLLRRSRIWWIRGRLKKPWPSEFERRYRVQVVDPRLHFALNCGGASCPPIRSYAPADIDAQLELATMSFLEQQVRVSEAGQVEVSALFNWYSADFGGPAGVRAFVKKRGFPIGEARLKFLPYDWSPMTQPFHQP